MSKPLSVVGMECAVRTQLRLILNSEPFARARRMQRFLEFVVEETLAGHADRLGEYGIAIAVFDRTADFEPALDPIVRNDARRLRVKLAESYAQHCPRPADVVIEIPKGSYVPVFHRDQRQFPAPAPSRRLAVLPFEEISGTSGDPVCARAFCMSLTAALTEIDGIETVAHGFVRERSVRIDAAELGVTHIINGCVWNAGGQLHVIVNLIEMAEGTQIWAQEYDFGTSESPSIQSRIGASVVREVTVRLGLRPACVGLAVAA